MLVGVNGSFIEAVCYKSVTSQSYGPGSAK